MLFFFFFNLTHNLHISQTNQFSKSHKRANSADDILMILLFLFFSQTGDNLHEMSNCIFWEEIRKIVQTVAAEIFTQYVENMNEENK